MDMRHLFLLVRFMGVLCLMAACTQIPSVDPDVLPSREPSDCPQLESQLYQVTQAEDPLQAAEQLGLNVKNGKVQVHFVLQSEETDFLLEYDIELGSQSGNQVQGYVPIDRLCELANLDPVLAIRRVSQPILD